MPSAFVSFLFHLNFIFIFNSIFNSPTLVPEARNLYYREKADMIYSSWSFLLAYVLHFLPTLIVSSLIVASLSFYGININPSAPMFLIFWGGLSLVLLLGEG